MKTLLVHFGTHKTGSSSIQEYLSTLHMDDITFIQPYHPNASQLVYEAFLSPLSKEPQYAQSGLTEEAIIQLQRHQRQNYLKALEKVKTPRAILSAEALSHFNTASLTAFHEATQPFFDKIIYIGYFRHPYSLIPSSLQEMAKRFSREYILRTLMFKDHLAVQDLENLAGKENVHCHLFQKDALAQNCVVHDFCLKYNIPLPSSPFPKANERLSLEAFQLLLCFWDYYNLNTPWNFWEKHLISFPEERYRHNLLKTQQIIEKLQHIKGRKLEFSQTALDSMLKGIGLKYKEWFETTFPQAVQTPPSETAIPSLDYLTILQPESVQALQQLTGKKIPLSASPATIAKIVASLSHAKIRTYFPLILRLLLPHLRRVGIH